MGNSHTETQRNREKTAVWRERQRPQRCSLEAGHPCVGGRRAPPPACRLALACRPGSLPLAFRAVGKELVVFAAPGVCGFAWQPQDTHATVLPADSRCPCGSWTPPFCRCALAEGHSGVWCTCCLLSPLSPGGPISSLEFVGFNFREASPAQDVSLLRVRIGGSGVANREGAVWPSAPPGTWLSQHRAWMQQLHAIHFHGPRSFHFQCFHLRPVNPGEAKLTARNCVQLRARQRRGSSLLTADRTGTEQACACSS